MPNVADKVAEQVIPVVVLCGIVKVCIPESVEVWTAAVVQREVVFVVANESLLIVGQLHCGAEVCQCFAVSCFCGCLVVHGIGSVPEQNGFTRCKPTVLIVGIGMCYSIGCVLGGCIGRGTGQNLGYHAGIKGRIAGIHGTVTEKHIVVDVQGLIGIVINFNVLVPVTYDAAGGKLCDERLRKLFLVVNPDVVIGHVKSGHYTHNQRIAKASVGIVHLPVGILLGGADQSAVDVVIHTVERVDYDLIVVGGFENATIIVLNC